MMLTIKTETIHKVDYHDIQQFIAATYGLTEFCAIGESENDSVHEYNVTSKDGDEYDAKRLDEILADKYCTHWELGIVLDDLCRKGLLPAGNYLVDVCW